MKKLSDRINECLDTCECGGRQPCECGSEVSGVDSNKEVAKIDTETGSMKLVAEEIGKKAKEMVYDLPDLNEEEKVKMVKEAIETGVSAVSDMDGKKISELAVQTTDVLFESTNLNEARGFRDTGFEQFDKVGVMSGKLKGASGEIIGQAFVVELDNGNTELFTPFELFNKS